jgi:hypothetical protein
MSAMNQDTRHPNAPASARWWGFPEVFDIDAPLKARHGGAPVIDRNGRVVGIAISSLNRFGSRAKCHVIPAHVAVRLIADWN